MQHTYNSSSRNTGNRYLSSTDPNAQYSRPPAGKPSYDAPPHRETKYQRGYNDDDDDDGRDDRSKYHTSNTESHLEYHKSKAEKVEDRGECSTFYPITHEWQRQKSRKLRISCERFITCGDKKRFYERTPPKRTLTVRGDGNCFFRAISKVITGTETEHMSVRAAVTKHVSDHPDMYRTFLMSRGGMQEYLSSMRRSSEWATDTEILATATLLQTVVMVYFPCHIKGRYEYRWQTFKPLDNPDMTQPVIYLCNKNDHFDPVVDVESE